MRLVSLLLAMVALVVACGTAAAHDGCRVERVRCCEPKPKCCEPVAVKCCEPKTRVCMKRVKVCETVTKCDRCGNEVTRTRVRHERVQVNPDAKNSTPKLTPVPVPVPAA